MEQITSDQTTFKKSDCQYLIFFTVDVKKIRCLHTDLVDIIVFIEVN